MTKAERPRSEPTDSFEAQGRAAKTIIKAAKARTSAVQPEVDPTNWTRKRLALQSPDGTEVLKIEFATNPNALRKPGARGSNERLTIRSEVLLPSIDGKKKAYSLKFDPDTLNWSDQDAALHIYAGAGILSKRSKEKASKICIALSTWETTGWEEN